MDYEYKPQTSNILCSTNTLLLPFFTLKIQNLTSHRLVGVSHMQTYLIDLLIAGSGISWHTYISLLEFPPLIRACKCSMTILPKSSILKTKEELDKMENSPEISFFYCLKATGTKQDNILEICNMTKYSMTS